MNWKTQRPAEREATKIIFDNLTIYRQGKETYFIIENRNLSTSDKRKILTYLRTRN